MNAKSPPSRAVAEAQALRERGFSQSEIARRMGVKRGYVSHMLTGRVTPSPKREQAMLSSLKRVQDAGSTKITVWQAEAAAQQSGERVTTFEQPATLRDRKLLAAYQDEVMKFVRGEPYDLRRFEGRRIYVGRKDGKHRITLETNPDALRRLAERGELDADRVFKYELIDTPGGKSKSA